MNRGLLRSELQAYLVKANNQLIKHQVDINNDTTGVFVYLFRQHPT